MDLSIRQDESYSQLLSENFRDDLSSSSEWTICVDNGPNFLPEHEVLAKVAGYSACRDGLEDVVVLQGCVSSGVEPNWLQVGDLGSGPGDLQGISGATSQTCDDSWEALRVVGDQPKVAKWGKKNWTVLRGEGDLVEFEVTRVRPVEETSFPIRTPIRFQKCPASHPQSAAVLRLKPQTIPPGNPESHMITILGLHEQLDGSYPFAVPFELPPAATERLMEEDHNLQDGWAIFSYDIKLMEKVLFHLRKKSRPLEKMRESRFEFGEHAWHSWNGLPPKILDMENHEDCHYWDYESSMSLEDFLEDNFILPGPCHPYEVSFGSGGISDCGTSGPSSSSPDPEFMVCGRCCTEGNSGVLAGTVRLDDCAAYRKGRLRRARETDEVILGSAPGFCFKDRLRKSRDEVLCGAYEWVDLRNVMYGDDAAWKSPSGQSGQGDISPHKNRSKRNGSWANGQAEWKNVERKKSQCGSTKADIANKSKEELSVEQLPGPLDTDSEEDLDSLLPSSSKVQGDYSEINVDLLHGGCIKTQSDIEFVQNGCGVGGCQDECSGKGKRYIQEFLKEIHREDGWEDFISILFTKMATFDDIQSFFEVVLEQHGRSVGSRVWEMMQK